MQSENKWNRFEKSGKVEDYLAYRSAREETDENDHRCAGDLGSEDGGSRPGPDPAE